MCGSWISNPLSSKTTKPESWIDQVFVGYLVRSSSTKSCDVIAAVPVVTASLPVLPTVVLFHPSSLVLEFALCRSQTGSVRREGVCSLPFIIFSLVPDGAFYDKGEGVRRSSKH